jgi:hypothetical protein
VKAVRPRARDDVYAPHRGADRPLPGGERAALEAAAENTGRHISFSGIILELPLLGCLPVDVHNAQVFAVFDADGSGSIDASELGSCLRALGQVLASLQNFHGRVDSLGQEE